MQNTQGNPEPPLILIIDDDPALRPMLAKLLDRKGYRTCQAEDGVQGITLFRERAPDIVITDLIMPNQEGLETIALLQDINPEVPIIAMSGNVILPNGRELSTASSLECAAEIGAKYIFQKPFELEDLLAAVEALKKSATR